MNNLSIRKINELSTKKKKGFTLIELIIVIAIIAILAAMAIPKFGQIRENANQKADIATAKNIATIVAQGVSDGTITTSATVTSVSTDKVGPKLDGTITPKALAANNAATFFYDIDATTGNIVIYYGDAVGDTKQVYPTYNAVVTAAPAAADE